jgi:hypothetical protein
MMVVFENRAVRRLILQPNLKISQTSGSFSGLTRRMPIRGISGLGYNGLTSIIKIHHLL